MLSEKKIFEITENFPNKTKTTNKIEDYTNNIYMTPRKTGKVMTIPHMDLCSC